MGISTSHNPMVLNGPSEGYLDKISYCQHRKAPHKKQTDHARGCKPLHWTTRGQINALANLLAMEVLAVRSWRHLEETRAPLCTLVHTFQNSMVTQPLIGFRTGLEVDLTEVTAPPVCTGHVKQIGQRPSVSDSTEGRETSPLDISYTRNL
jgi:hypothetical protein